MATTAVIALTAATLIDGVLSAPPCNTSETRQQGPGQREQWNEPLKQAPDSYQNNAALDEMTADTRKALSDKAKRWPGAIVPYSISPSVLRLHESAGSIIKEAMSHWENHTCIRFKLRPKMIGNDSVSIVNGSWCESEIGRIGGNQELTLALRCLNVPTVIHELGHTIGWVHEHSRPDRDNHVNIVPGIVNDPNYSKYDDKTIDTFGVPYDHSSIMHYSGENNSITAHDTSKQHVMGRSKKLSFYDVKLANLMYNCAEQNKCNVDSMKCIDDGYVGPKCTCVCRDERKGCTEDRRSKKPDLSTRSKKVKID